MKTFEREFRYYVFKAKDVEKHLNSYSTACLKEIGAVIEHGRKTEGKSPLRCVVVEEDWPMYESTWKAIEDYHDTKVFEDELRTLSSEQLKTRVRNQRKSIKSLQDAIEELRGTPRDVSPPTGQ